MPKLKFYNVKTKKSFSTDNFYLTKKSTSKGVRYFAVAEKPGIDVYRIVSKDFYMKYI